MSWERSLCQPKTQHVGNWAQIGKDPIELSTVKGKDLTTWRPWMGENWNILEMWSTWGGTINKSEPGRSITMDELRPCPFTYVLLMFDAVCVGYYYYIIYYVVSWLRMKLWSLYLLNKKALVCMCLICKRYLCYVQNVVWILNLHAIFIQANPQGG